MTEFSGCSEIRLALGVYVLGAIEPAERALVDAHLSDCQGCREELAGLAGLPALLGKVPLPDVEQLALDDTELRDLEEPPAELLDSLLGRISARRRARLRRVVISAAAAAVIAVGGGIGGGMLIPHGQGLRPVHPVSELAVGTNAKTHATAVITYIQKQSGTSMNVLVAGIPVGTRCEFWVTTTSGQQLPVGGWTVNGDHNNTNWYRASSQVAAAMIRSFDIIANGKVLVNVLAT